MEKARVVKSGVSLDLRAFRGFCEERVDQVQARRRAQGTLFLNIFKLESASVQITSVDVIRKGGADGKCAHDSCDVGGRQAGKSTSRREKSRRALT